MEIFSLILSALKALPVLDRWFQGLVTAYTNSKLESMKLENFEAIKEALEKNDQRRLEAAIGNPHPGYPSNDSGSVVVDVVPGILRDKETN